MSTLAANETRRQVRYDYTPTERIAKATGLAEALNKYTATENEKKRIAKDYDARLDIIQAEIDQLNNSVLSGYELREYLCFWTYDEPRTGRKTLRKREGGEVVAEEDMTEQDRQMVIEIIDGQAKDEDKGGQLVPFRPKSGKRDRRANGSGTVDVPADEGSRDDAGSEGKNDL